MKNSHDFYLFINLHTIQPPRDNTSRPRGYLFQYNPQKDFLFALYVFEMIHQSLIMIKKFIMFTNIICILAQL